MVLSQDNKTKLNRGFLHSKQVYEATLMRTTALSQFVLVQPKALEYMNEGVGRRLKVVFRGISNIFRIFPPQRTNLLNEDELVDICINLHAFYINIFGLFDNLAWVLVYERQLTIHRNDVGLYFKKMRRHLAPEFDSYLQSILPWHDEHLKHYRDALAHRIPMYLPPYFLPTDQPSLDSSEQNSKPQIGFAFSESFTESPKLVVMHAQLLADFNTVESIVRYFCKFEFPIAESIAAYFLDRSLENVDPPREIRPYLAKYINSLPPEIQKNLDGFFD